MKVCSITAAATAALGVSLATAAGAQEKVQQDTSVTEAHAPGVKRLREAIDVLNTGDYAKTRAYFDANSVGAPNPNASPYAMPFSGHVPTFSHILNLHRRSGGFDLVRITTYPARSAVVGILRNRLTGDEEY